MRRRTGNPVCSATIYIYIVYINVYTYTCVWISQRWTCLSSQICARGRNSQSNRRSSKTTTSESSVHKVKNQNQKSKQIMHETITTHNARLRVCKSRLLPHPEMLMQKMLTQNQITNPNSQSTICIYRPDLQCPKTTGPPEIAITVQPPNTSSPPHPPSATSAAYCPPPASPAPHNHYNSPDCAPSQSARRP